ncbi:MAG: hypothetical protein JWR77_1180 [Rhizorhabdus sp.]|nr:hypothetical protein [Rhizorhabdus sp.]
MRMLLAVLLLIFSGPAAAHLTPNSEISLAFGRTKVAADIVVPMGELGYATGVAVERLTPQALSHYFLRRIAVRAPDGRPWRVAITGMKLSADAELRLVLTPPAGAPVRRFDLDYAAVIDRVPNHFVLIAVRSDTDGGRLSDRPQMLGALQQGNMTIRIDRGTGSAWRGFASAIGLGMHHIAEGHDHLLFLIALLLPAPLLVQGRRWAGYGGLRFTARRLLAVVTAFTIGHSLTLIGGAAFGWQLPAQPVEVAIAVSILVSAFHAWRPIFAGKEALIAGCFGLVHGLAFATLIARFGLEPLQKAQSILGFNIGIELVQIVVVAVVMPVLVAMARTSSYATFRIGAALFAGIAATAWIIERVFAVENVVGRAIDAGLSNAPWLLAALVATAGAMMWGDRRRLAPPVT